MAARFSHSAKALLTMHQAPLYINCSSLQFYSAALPMLMDECTCRLVHLHWEAFFLCSLFLLLSLLCILFYLLCFAYKFASSALRWTLQSSSRDTLQSFPPIVTPTFPPVFPPLFAPLFCPSPRQPSQVPPSPQENIENEKHALANLAQVCNDIEDGQVTLPDAIRIAPPPEYDAEMAGSVPPNYDEAVHQLSVTVENETSKYFSVASQNS